MSSTYAVDRFLAAPESAGPPEWLDDQGLATPDRNAAGEVRLTKRGGGKVLMVRLPIDEALSLGLIREAT